ncbi:MAG: hypothetical protein NZ701_00820 [Roseiflexus sp.]|nr:hypothetical protein [Roseiflexus sp.]
MVSLRDACDQHLVNVTERSCRDGVRSADRNKLIDIARIAPETVVLADDEAKVSLRTSTMAGWAPRGATVTVRVDPGRAPTAVYGTLDRRRPARLW